MAQVVYLTTEPVRVVGGSAKQDLRLALDVSMYDVVDLVLQLLEGSNVTIKIITSMQNEDNVEGWVNANGTAPFGATITAPISAKATFENCLKYIRWEVTTATTCTFMISGIGRRWS